MQHAVQHVRSDPDRDSTMDDMNCAYVFESVNGLFLALEANGRFIQSDLDWDLNDQTDAVIMQNTNK